MRNNAGRSPWRRSKNGAGNWSNVSIHIPTDQAVFAAGGAKPEQLCSKDAAAAGGCSFGIPAASAPASVLGNGTGVCHLYKVLKLHAEIMEDHSMGAALKQVAINLLDEENWDKSLLQEQKFVGGRD